MSAFEHLHAHSIARHVKQVATVLELMRSYLGIALCLVICCSLG
jgi:hypothetical protein